MPIIYKVVDADRASHEDAAEVEITPLSRLDALDALAPENEAQVPVEDVPGAYHVLSAPAEDHPGDDPPPTAT